MKTLFCIVQERSLRIISKQWFAVAGRKSSRAEYVNDFLDALERLAHSQILLRCVVNLLDNNVNKITESAYLPFSVIFFYVLQGNSVLHYALSHNNLPVVGVLLDSKVSQVDLVNRAGYTALMLASLARLSSHEDGLIVCRLFHLGDVNRKAQQVRRESLLIDITPMTVRVQ